MKTLNQKSLGILASANTPKLATVNPSYRKNSLLRFALAVLFVLNILGANVVAQGNDSAIPMLRQFSAKSAQFDKMFDDKNNNRLIFTYVKDVTVLNGVDLTPGVRVLFLNKTTGDVLVAPDPLKNAKHVYMYNSKLFYIIDSTDIYSFDLKTGEVKLLLKANDRIIGFWNMSNNRILVNARTGGAINVPNALTVGSVSRLAIYNYETGEVVNISNNENIFQAFSVGKKIVFLESGSWFNKPGVSFRANVFDPYDSQTYSRSDFNILCLNIPTSESTFILWYNPIQGGSWRMAVVNVDTDLHNGTFNKDDVLEVGGFWAPPIAGGNTDPSSPSTYFMNNEKVAGGQWWEKNLKTSQVNNRTDEEIWSTNLLTFNESYVGKFYDPIQNRPIYSGNLIDGRFTSFNENGFYTSKLYGEVNAVKSVRIPGVSVYPNPAVGITNITIPGNGKVAVYTTTGQVIFSQDFTGNISVPVNSGLNIVKVIIGTQTQVFKVLGQ